MKLNKSCIICSNAIAEFNMSGVCGICQTTLMPSQVNHIESMACGIKMDRRVKNDS